MRKRVAVVFISAVILILAFGFILIKKIWPVKHEDLVYDEIVSALSSSSTLELEDCHLFYTFNGPQTVWYYCGQGTDTYTLFDCVVGVGYERPETKQCVGKVINY